MKYKFHIEGDSTNVDKAIRALIGTEYGKGLVEDVVNVYGGHGTEIVEYFTLESSDPAIVYFNLHGLMDHDLYEDTIRRMEGVAAGIGQQLRIDEGISVSLLFIGYEHVDLPPTVDPFTEWVTEDVPEFITETIPQAFTSTWESIKAAFDQAAVILKVGVVVGGVYGLIWVMSKVEVARTVKG